MSTSKLLQRNIEGISKSFVERIMFLSFRHFKPHLSIKNLYRGILAQYVEIIKDFIKRDEGE